MRRSLALMLAGCCLSMTAHAQFEADLSGFWGQKIHEDWQEEGDGPDLGDFLGLPVNDEARTRALSYSASSLSLPERQCLYYAPNYIVAGLLQLSISSETDPATGEVVAWVIGPGIDRGSLYIWMDGRKPPPKDAPRRVGGFTTGQWIGNTLKTVTVGSRQGYVRRNGTPSSDQSTFTMHITRHGNILTVTGTVEDPVYLTAPLVRSRVYVLNPSNLPGRSANPCVPAAEVASLSGDGAVPHVDPQTNAVSQEFARTYGLPLSAVLGGEATMFPEFRKTLKELYQRPEKCIRYCCGWQGNGSAALPLDCEITASPRYRRTVQPGAP